MQLPEYITVAEVKRVCDAAGLRDWSEITDPIVSEETMDYYERIEVAEMEGDLLKAVLSRNLEKIESKYKQHIGAQKALTQTVAKQIK